MAASVLKRANTAYQEWAQDAPGAFSAQILPLFIAARAARRANDAASDHRHRAGGESSRRRIEREANLAGGESSSLSLAFVQQDPVPLPLEEVPVYSIAVEPPSSRGELRWLGRLFCFVTALTTGSAMVAAFVL